VAHVHTLVYDGDDGASRAGPGVPGLGRVHVGVGGPGLPPYRLPGVVEAPEPAEAGVVGGRGRVDLEVRLGVLDVRRGLVALYRLAHPEFAWQIHQVNVAAREVLLRTGVVLLVQRGEVRLGGVLLQRDDHLSRDVLPLVRRGERGLLRRSALRLGLHLLGGASVDEEAD
jgi:hypothetical protein